MVKKNSKQLRFFLNETEDLEWSRQAKTLVSLGNRLTQAGDISGAVEALKNAVSIYNELASLAIMHTSLFQCLRLYSKPTSLPIE